jgi:2-keto-4-pentenoate hydratase
MTPTARDILAAFETGTVIPTPNLDLATACAVEAELASLRIAQGHRTVGRKVGYANRAMWRALKLESLVWAHMYDDTVHILRDHPTHSLNRYISPRIEPEIVIKINSSTEDWDWYAIGFEIIDCPYPKWEFKPPDFVAALGLHRALIYSEPIHVDPATMPALLEQLASFRLKLLKNGAVVEEGAGKNSLKSPALCVAELNRIAPLEPGEIISTGTLTAAQPIASGETWEVQLDGLPAPPLTLRLS